MSCFLFLQNGDDLFEGIVNEKEDDDSAGDDAGEEGSQQEENAEGDNEEEEEEEPSGGECIFYSLSNFLEKYQNWILLCN